jgi:hypothetical protein
MNVAGSCLVLCTVVSLPSSIVELLLLRKSVSMQAASPEKPHNNERKVYRYRRIKRYNQLNFQHVLHMKQTQSFYSCEPMFNLY